MNSARNISRGIRRLFFVFMASLLIVTLVSWQSPFLALAHDESDDQTTLYSEADFVSNSQNSAIAPPQKEATPASEATGGKEPEKAESASKPAIDSESIEVIDAPEEGVSESEIVSDNLLRSDSEPRASINGQCGTCQWSLNTDTGELRIGAGTLKSCDSPSAWSWNNYRVYVKSVTFTGYVYADTDAQSMFFNMKNLTTINYFNRFYTTATTNISGMFANCTSLVSVVFPPSFSTAKTTNMSSLFSGCDSLISVNLSSFDTRSITTMAHMFEGCSSLIEVQVGNLFALSFDGAFPTPSGLNQDGKIYSGRWKAASDGALYLPSAIPSYVADTYRAAILNPSVSISGSTLEGQTLTAAISDAGSYAWVYQWSRSDSETGSYVDIGGANSLTYTTSVDDRAKYLRFTASYDDIVIFSTIGPIEKGVPLAPTITAVTLNSNGNAFLEFTTAASFANPYESIFVAYMTDSGILKEYGDVPCDSIISEAKTLTIDLTPELEREHLPTMVYFWIKAKNAAGLSEWSNLGALDPIPQISVTVPTASFGNVSADGEIIIHDSPQDIKNTGTLDVKITSISFSQVQENHPISNWVCTLETDISTVLWEGSSKNSAAVEHSPVIKPGRDIGLLWTGTMTNTDGIELSTTPVNYGTITYTFGFAAS